MTTEAKDSLKKFHKSRINKSLKKKLFHEYFTKLILSDSFNTTNTPRKST